MSEKKTRSKLGCLAMGCFGVIIAVIAGGLILYFGTKYALDFALDKYTDDRPTAFAKSNLSVDDAVKLESEFEKFRTRVDVDLPTKPLELDTDQMNHLIETDAKFSTLKDKVRLKIVKNEVRGNISIPIDIVRQIYPDLPQINMLSGRYLNANVTVNLRLEGGQLEAYLKQMSIKGDAVPENMMARIRDRDLFKDDRISGQLTQQFKKLRDVKIENGKIILVGSGGTVEELMNNRK
ncbi:MAG: hypothetical protein HOH33_15655 [Verrucomicrobia bacterium]|jgi:hypothetical protein|nr:hypothetical protein [Verrucomicrobiota bacterium]